MTTVIPFLPANQRAPTFTATLDGDNYNIVVTWNVAAQRYYINVYAMDGTWIVTCPLIQSPLGENVASFTYDPAARNVTLVKASGVRQRVGSIMRYWLRDFQPTTINGYYPRCLVLNDLSFSFAAGSDPGPVVALGTVHRRLNIVAGIFKNSTIIYRNGAFEIDP